MLVENNKMGWQLPRHTTPSKYAARNAHCPTWKQNAASLLPGHKYDHFSGQLLPSLCVTHTILLHPPRLYAPTKTFSSFMRVLYMFVCCVSKCVHFLGLLKRRFLTS